VVGVISAYNFPAAVWAQNGFLAAIGGNTVIWKPSPKVPLTAIGIQHLCNQAMKDPRQGRSVSFRTTTRWPSGSSPTAGWR
jgi:acyl-CoA reductase-like NAD-dependent aldehyde dehydrogenase